MSCVNRRLIFLQDDSLGVPEIFLPRNRILIHRGDDLTWELSSRQFEIIKIVNLRKHLGDFQNTDNLSDEASSDDRQNPGSFWPVARYLKAGMQIPLPGLLNEIEQTP